MADQLRWGVVGCGNVVEKKSGPSIMAAGNSRIVAVMRRDADKARPFAEANGVDVCTDAPAAVIDHPDVDIVYVATPPSSHLQYVLAAAAAGKHVLVEKPMGLNAQQDREMIAACEQAGVTLFTAYYRRFHPHVLKMKELIDSGRIGTPVMAQIDWAQPPLPGYDWGWRVQPEISGGGLFNDVVSHRIDLMVYLLGEPESVCGVKGDHSPGGAVEDAAAMAVKFAGGALCSISGEFASSRSADRFVISGTEGTICSERLDGHAFTLTVGEKSEDFAFEPYSAPHLGLIRHIEKVIAAGEPNQCSGQAGLWTDVILDEGLQR